MVIVSKMASDSVKSVSNIVELDRVLVYPGCKKSFSDIVIQFNDTIISIIESKLI